MTKKASLGIVWDEQTVAVSDLQPYERNPRKITPEVFERLKESLRVSGYHQRILVQPDLRVVGGHQRIKALQQLGIAEVKVLVPNRELTVEEFRRILIQDNLAYGEFDMIMLGEDFQRAELESFGMPENLLDKLPEQVTDGKTDPDAVPAAREKVTARAGDIWMLGLHRLACGDCTDATLVERLLDGARPNLMVTDPPYGVEYDPAWRERAGVASAGIAKGAVLNDHRADWREAWSLFPGAVAYIWHGALHAPIVAASLEATGFKVRAQIIWVKTRAALSRGHYHWQHEPAFYAQKPNLDDHWRFGMDHEVAGYMVREGQPAGWHGGRKQTSVWFIDHIKNETGHSTQKPVMCMQRPIENNTLRGEAVYDPFLGSGTTLIAAQRTGRVCYGCELNPVYADIIIRRWQDFTGQKAVRFATGETFDAITPEPVSHETDGKKSN